jgi:hypothetical protein
MVLFADFTKAELPNKKGKHSDITISTHGINVQSGNQTM